MHPLLLDHVSPQASCIAGTGCAGVFADAPETHRRINDSLSGLRVRAKRGRWEGGERGPMSLQQ